MRAILNVLAVVVALTLLAPQALTQNAPKAAAKAAGEPLTVKVKDLKGIVKRLSAAQKAPKWVPVKVDETLDELTVIRTGFRSEVTLEFADNSIVIIEAATRLGIAEFRKDKGVTRTRLHMKHGAIRATIHKARGPNDFTVTTPVAICGAIGTGGRISYTNGLLLIGNSGNWRITRGHQVKNVKAGELSNGRKNSIEIKKYLAAVKFLGLGQGLTPQELKSHINHGSGRGDLRITQGHRTFLRNLPPSHNSGGMQNLD